jgi:hypothetical protein
MSIASVALKQILTTIQQEDPSAYIAATDIYNERTTIQLDYLQ